MDFDKYLNKKPFKPSAQDPAMYREYQQEESRLVTQFKLDACKELGIEGHPKGCRAVELAWDYGHSSGLREVFNYLTDLSDLMKD